MRKLLTVIIGLLCATFLGAQTAENVENGGFESWISGEPLSWRTSNSNLYFPITRSIDSHSGTYAAFGQAIEKDESYVAPKLKAGANPDFGFRVSENYNRLTFYLKFDKGVNDTLVASVRLANESFATIGIGTMVFHENLEEYTLATVPIDYESDDTATNAFVEFEIVNGTGQFSLDSWFLIDDVELSLSVALSDENDILTFTFPEETGAAVIDTVEHRVDIEVANGTDLTSLTPIFTISEGATADPVSGTTSDYSSPFTITVTAEDGSAQDWEVVVNEAVATAIDDPKSTNSNIEIYPNPVKDILSIKTDERISGIVITSLNGKVIKKYNQPELSTINVSDLKPGTFIISFFDEDVRIMSGKIMKE